MKKYEAPELFVEEYIPDTMIASTIPGSSAKNDNPGNNQSCWGCRNVPGALDPNDITNLCCVIPSDEAYGHYCI